MAIKLSAKGIGVKNKIIDKRKGYIDNPVEDIMNTSHIRVKRYDKTKLNIRYYLSREDIAQLQRMPASKKQELLYHFSNTAEFKKLEKAIENVKQENDIVSSINLSKPHKFQRETQYADDHMYLSGKKSTYKEDSHINESSTGFISLSDSAFTDSDIVSVINNTDDIHSVLNHNGIIDTQENISYTSADKDNLKSSISDKNYNGKIKTRIKLSEDNESGDQNNSSQESNNKKHNFRRKNKRHSSEESTYYSQLYSQDKSEIPKVTQSEQSLNKMADITKKGTEAAANTGAAVSSAGTTEVVKLAEKAIEKYADTIKQAVMQEEAQANENNNNNPDNGTQSESITTKASGMMSKITAVVLAVTSLLFANMSVILIPFILIIMCVFLIATLVVSVISSIAGVVTNTVNKVANGIKMQLLSENTISYMDDMREAANDNEILNYVNYLMAIMEVESHGNGNDPMQSSESAGLPPDSFDNPKDSINQGVYYFACCISKANDEGCDLMSAVQAYNYGTGFINYVADNGGQYTLDLAISFAEQHSGGMQVDYSNPIAVDYNGGWRYAYGNMFYAQLVSQYIYSYEDDAVQKIVDEAMKYYGWEYTWGGSNPDEGFDCSGLVQWCYGIAGIDLPRTSREQWEWCEEISVEDIVPGDLLFYQNESSDGEIGHVAIYIGDGKVYEAGDPIGVYDNNDSWHQDNLLHAGRVIHFEPEENSESSDE